MCIRVAETQYAHQTYTHEAEDAQLVFPMAVYDDDTRASRGKYVSVKTNNKQVPEFNATSSTWSCVVDGYAPPANNDMVVNDGKVLIQPNIILPAVFRIDVRMLVPATSSNSFFVTVTSPAEVLLPTEEWHLEDSEEWQVQPLPNPCIAMDRGIHNITLQYRELDTGIDWVRISTDFDPPKVLEVGGCPTIFNVDLNTTTQACPTDGGSLLQITGNNFCNVDAVTVTVGGVACTVTSVTDVDLTCSSLAEVSTAQQLDCVLPRMGGRDRPVVVTLNGKSDTSVVHFAPPEVTHVSGCTTGDARSLNLEGCSRDGGDTIVIYGENFGGPQDEVSVQIGNSPCFDVVHRLVSDADGTHTALECRLPAGTNEALEVVVVVDEQASTATAASAPLAISYAQIGCKRDGCSGHGTCNLETSACACDTMFTGAKCETDLGLVVVMPVVLTVVLLCVVAAVAIAVRRALRAQVMTYEITLNQSVNIPFDDITLLKSLGMGSFGEVFLAKWRGSNVAVKRSVHTSLTTAVVREFVEETETMFNLRHPNIVLLMGACAELPDIALVLEFMPHGNTLEALADDMLAIAMERRLLWSYQICQAMSFLHASNIIHYDLKTPNVMLSGDWNCKVTDFGMSKLKHNAITDESQHGSRFSRSRVGTLAGGGTTSRFSGRGSIHGSRRSTSRFGTGPVVASADTQLASLFWSAPEIIRQEPDVSFPLDVYSFGIILWEMVTRESPYVGMNPLAVANSVVTNDLRPRVDHIPENMVHYVDLMRACWHPMANARPSMADVLASFEARQESFEVAVPPPTRSEVIPQSGFMCAVSATWVNEVAMHEAYSVQDLAEISAYFVETVREVVRRHGGYTVASDGIVYTATFQSPTHARAFVASLVTTLAAHRQWPVPAAAPAPLEGTLPPGSAACSPRNPADRGNTQAPVIPAPSAAGIAIVTEAKRSKKSNKDKEKSKNKADLTTMTSDESSTSSSATPTSSSFDSSSSLSSSASSADKRKAKRKAKKAMRKARKAKKAAKRAKRKARRKAKNKKKKKQKKQTQEQGQEEEEEQQVENAVQLEVAIVGHAGVAHADFSGNVKGTLLDELAQATERVNSPLVLFSSAFSDVASAVLGDNLPTPEVCVFSQFVMNTPSRRDQWLLFPSDIVLGDRLVLTRHLCGFYGQMLPPGGAIPGQRADMQEVYIEQLIGKDMVSAEIKVGLRKEAARLVRIRHGNLLTLRGLVTTGPKLSFVFDAREPLLPLSEVLAEGFSVGDGKFVHSVLYGAAQGLQALHAQSLIHGDFDTNNVLVESRTGQTRLCSYGFAASKRCNATMTSTEKEVCLAPEVIMGDEPSAMADVYGLGMLGIWLLNETMPFEDIHLFEFIQTVCNPKAEGRPTITHARCHQEISQCLLRCIDVNPQARPSIDEVVGVFARRSSVLV